MNLKTTTKRSIFAFFFFSFLLSSIDSMANSGGYLTFHYDIKLAMEEEDYKKAKSLVESLIPIVESDIAYSRSLLADEEDEYMIKSLTAKVARQEEIHALLESFLGEKRKNLAGFDSLDVIRELRRLSVKPKER